MDGIACGGFNAQIIFRCERSKERQVSIPGSIHYSYPTWSSQKVFEEPHATNVTWGTADLAMVIAAFDIYLVMIKGDLSSSFYYTKNNNNH